MAESKVRIQLDFSGKAVAELDDLKQKVEAPSRAEVIRNSLRWLRWCVEETAQGGKFIIEKDGKSKEVVFPYSASR